MSQGFLSWIDPWALVSPAPPRFAFCLGRYYFCLASRGGGITYESTRWKIIQRWEWTAGHAAPAGKNQGCVIFTLPISWGKTKKKGRIEISLFSAPPAVITRTHHLDLNDSSRYWEESCRLVTTSLHLRCPQAPDPGRWCRQSMCDYRWPFDGWPPWRSCILLGPALFPAGGDVRKQRGLHWQGFTGGTGRVLRAVIAVPASDRPLLALTSVLGAEIYRILCWQESLSLLLSQVIVGNPNFQWNTIVPQCRMRGNVRLLPAAFTV